MAKIGTTNAYDSKENVTLNSQRASGTNEVGSDGGKLAVTSTNISVFANGAKVGFIQSFNPSESRNIVKIQELGTEGVVQSVPSNTNGGQLSISRFAVYNGNLFDALGATRSGNFVSAKDQKSGTSLDKDYRTYSNPFKTLKDQRVPLEIQVKTKMPSKDDKYYVETYIDCWLSSYSKTIAATTITITETATVQYSDVTASYV